MAERHNQAQMIRRFLFGCFTSLLMLVLVLGVALYFIVIDLFRVWWVR